MLSVLLLMKQMMGGAVLAWCAHFLIGTVAWGVLFAFLARSLPGPYWLKGIVFATGA